MNFEFLFGKKEQLKKKATLPSIDWEVLDDSTTTRKSVRRVFKFEDFRKVVAEMEADGYSYSEWELDAVDEKTNDAIIEIRNGFYYDISHYYIEYKVHHELLFNATMLSLVFVKESREDNKC